MKSTVVIGARGSHLAQAMVNEVIGAVLRTNPDRSFTRRRVMTTGDTDRTTALTQLTRAEVSLFASALESALLAGEIDVAVHSLKDLPTAMTPGLRLAAIPIRADARDVLCGSTLDALPGGARVGTGSPRRSAQLLTVRPDLEIVPVRGNVPARLSTLNGRVHAVVLASAGLTRLHRGDAITEYLDPVQFPPSPGQGAIAVQVRENDRDLIDLFTPIHDPITAAAVTAERDVLAALHGGCTVPVGAYAHADGEELHLTARVTSTDGGTSITAEAQCPQHDATGLGQRVADDLLDRGAAKILHQTE